jgi:hypothetical protein
MKIILLTLFCLLNTLFTFGQKQDSLVVVKIESGKTIKKFINGYLESFSTEMYAMNYGNVLSFTKTNDTIVIKNADESDAIVKFYIKNKKLIRELKYKNQEILFIANIDFDLNNLPSNSKIQSAIENNIKVSYCVRTNTDKVGGDYEKSFKLFGRLNLGKDLTNIDSVFNSIANFFSKEDALLRIYSSKYANSISEEEKETLNEQTIPSLTSYLETNEIGKIKEGIIWYEEIGTNGKYDIYSKGKIIKSGNKSLKEYQKNITEYIEKTYE